MRRLQNSEEHYLRGEAFDRYTTRGENPLNYTSAGSGAEVGVVLKPVSCKVCGGQVGWDEFGGEGLCPVHERMREMLKSKRDKVWKRGK